MGNLTDEEVDMAADGTSDLPTLKQGDTGQRVKDIQWQMSGHNRYAIQTYYGQIDGIFGTATGTAAKKMKYEIGYPAADCVPTAGALLRSYLLPLNATGAVVRPPDYVERAKERQSLYSYPLSKVGPLIGWPYQGTHTLGNWQSDRACDISVPVGTAVLACFGGTIGDNFGPLPDPDPRFAGLRLQINGATDSSWYGHLSAFAAGLGPGDQVTAGQVLGKSGSANGVPHLHWALEHGWPPTFLAQQGQV